MPGRVVGAINVDSSQTQPCSGFRWILGVVGRVVGRVVARPPLNGSQNGLIFIIAENGNNTAPRGGSTTSVMQACPRC